MKFCVEMSVLGVNSCAEMLADDGVFALFFVVGAQGLERSRSGTNGVE